MTTTYYLLRNKVKSIQKFPPIISEQKSNKDPLLNYSTLELGKNKKFEKDDSSLDYENLNLNGNNKKNSIKPNFSYHFSPKKQSYQTI